MLSGADNAQPEWTWQRCVDCPSPSPKTRIERVDDLILSQTPVALPAPAPVAIDPLPSQRTAIRFYADGTTLSLADHGQLRAWVRRWAADRQARVTLIAYADGTRRSHELSDERAREVQVALYKAGVPMPQFTREIVLVSDPAPVVQIDLADGSKPAAVEMSRSFDSESAGTRPTVAELADRATPSASPGELP